MTESLINIKAVKTANRSMILKLLYSGGQMSRKEIASVTGLTPAAVSQQVSQLISEGIVHEAYQESAAKRAGRREIMLDILREHHVCVGMLISAEVSRIGLMDFTGRILKEQRLEYNAFDSVQTFIDTIAREIEAMTQQHVQPFQRLVGCGLALKGIVSGKTGMWLDTYGILPEKQVDVLTHMEHRLGIPVAVEDNVRAMANAEALLSGYTSHDGMLFVKYGPGLGAAIYIDNKLYYGYKYMSAEMGHIWARVNKDGTPAMGLEEKVSENAVLKLVRARYGPQTTPRLHQLTRGNPDLLIMPTVLNAYGMGDNGVAEVLEEVIDYLVWGIHNAVCLLDPQKIVLYGDAFENERFLQRLLDVASRDGLLSGTGMTIEKSAFNSWLEVRSAASLAISRFLDCA